MKTIRVRAGALALAVAISLFATAPAFAARQDQEPRSARDHIIRLITKIRGILGVGTNDGPGVPTP